MALTIHKKKDETPEPPKGLPEGADRFVWTEIPGAKPHPKFAEVLKGPKRPEK